MIIEKYIESMSTSQICQDIRDLIENKEITYILIHTCNHYSNDENQTIQFSSCSENLRGSPRTLRTIYRYKREYIDDVIEKLLKAKEFSEIFHLQPLFNNDLGVRNIHCDGILFISINSIDHIELKDDGDVYATIYFKNHSNIEVKVFERSFLEKILEESSRYDLLI